ncbi:hypothetical protein BS50DRAFT_567224 [Corynespora cassiicola Philippines]|uniref:Secreted protein n=1 Tax=Corynespora cassiicola Philippines TaxID=1448308 RepID=A0A2T2P9Q1_CORCC|nr:hypothetical protein BS50DRAFT_567224 [Corynespora cassiicola Philippines]
MHTFVLHCLVLAVEMVCVLAPHSREGKGIIVVAVVVGPSPMTGEAVELRGFFLPFSLDDWGREGENVANHQTDADDDDTNDDV